ncbi:helicase-related protein, partial [Paenibacillus lemnae]
TAGGSPTAALGRWGLSAAQGAAAGAALRFLAEPAVPGSAAARFLIWAVTGAGKTEMIFPLLQSVLEARGRVLVAAPRRDVVLELAPRLAAAFPDQSVITLYGGSPDRWKRGGITLATTHQLLRFRHAFDLVVIDEIDAFPYHNDPMLDFAAKGACKPGGKYIYLSATPPDKLQREAASGRLRHAKVPARFHGHPLPVPSGLRVPSVQQCLAQGQLPASLIRRLQRSLARGAQVFLFVSRIRHIEPFVQLLSASLPRDIVIQGTSSVDADRANKVMSFRERDIRLLVTTTILERGVTVPMSDVFILDADSEMFDEAALIQMAGRAGRSKDDPAGSVVFGSPHWTRSQRLAIRQIKQMNRIAQKGGYLRSSF